MSSAYWFELGNTLNLIFKFFFAFFGLCTSVCAHTCSFCFCHDQAYSSFYSCLPHLSLSPCVLLRFVPLCFFRYGVPALFCAMLPYITQNGKTAVDHAKKCWWADRRAEVVALLKWWKGRCDVATWYQEEAVVSSPIFGMIVGSFSSPLPPFLLRSLAIYAIALEWSTCNM